MHRRFVPVACICAWMGALLLLGLGLPPGAASGQSALRPDAGRFRIFLQDIELGSDTFSTDAEGSSESDITVSLAGMPGRIHLSLQVHEGRLAQVVTAAEPGGKLTLTLTGARGRLGLAETAEESLIWKEVTVPTPLLPYCTLAPEQLGLLLAAYDLQAGGPQSFDIAYTNAASPTGRLIQGRLTLIPGGSRPMPVGGGAVPVLRYSLRVPTPAAGGFLDAEILTDRDRHVLMFRIPEQKLLVIRDGYEDLARFAGPVDPLLSAPTYPVRLERNIRVPMRDGVRLGADVYRPDAPGKFPVILQRTLYGRQNVPQAGEYARRGYVFVVQDVRGASDSEGAYHPYLSEGKDGYDTIEWCARQRWSRGDVGMIGASYDGFVPWAAAQEGNRHLKCLVAIACPPYPLLAARSIGALPALHIAGWFDKDAVGTERNYQAMVAAGRRYQKLVYGPWLHTVNMTTRLGLLDFGPSSIRDLDTLALRWFDHWLKEIKNGIETEPPVDVFLTGVNRWHTFAAWPPRGTKRVRWHLYSHAPGSGELSPGAVEHSAPLRGVSAGAEDIRAGLPEEPTTPSAIVLAYTSAVLETEVVVAGPISVRLVLSPEARDRDWSAVLEDVSPDGTVARLVSGLRRAPAAGLPAKPTRREATEVLEAPLDLGPLGHVFQKGHRLRLSLVSGRLPDAGHAPSYPIPPQNEAIGSASYLLLPTLPPSGLGVQETRKEGRPGGKIRK